MNVYLQILRSPRVAVLLCAASVVRLSPAVNDLAILLYVAEQTGSFAWAGGAAGAFALGTAIGSPLIARLSDRRGIALMSPFAVAHVAVLASIWLLGAHGASPAVLLAAALLAGGTYPPAGSALRAQWPDLLAGTPQLVEAAYALDSVAASISFMTGPLITAALVATVGAGVGSCRRPAARHCSRRSCSSPARPPGRPRRPGAACWARSAARGCGRSCWRSSPPASAWARCRSRSPASALRSARPGWPASLLALWSVSTAVVSLLYGMRVPKASLRTINVWATFALAVATLPIALAWSPASMAILLVISGAPYGPMFVTANQLVAAVAPRGTATEAYSWVVTSLVAGTALGAAVSGIAVESSSWQLRRPRGRHRGVRRGRDPARSPRDARPRRGAAPAPASDPAGVPQS